MASVGRVAAEPPRVGGLPLARIDQRRERSTLRRGEAGQHEHRIPSPPVVVRAAGRTTNAAASRANTSPSLAPNGARSPAAVSCRRTRRVRECRLSCRVPPSNVGGGPAVRSRGPRGRRARRADCRRCTSRAACVSPRRSGPRSRRARSPPCAPVGSSAVGSSAARPAASPGDSRWRSTRTAPGDRVGNV